MHHYGFRGVAYDWLSSYLRNRTQTTSIGDCVSEKLAIPLVLSLRDLNIQNIQQNSFSRLGARIWNSIPPTIRNLRKSSFKKNIKNLLFKVLIEYDDYVDVHKIIQIVPNCNFSTD